MDEKHERNNIIAPRGHAKTTIAILAGTLWHIFCSDAYHGRKRGKKFVIIISKSRSHAVNLLTTIKNVLEYSEYFKALFGYHGQMDHGGRWREDGVILNTGDIIMCRGMTQPTRGLNIFGVRPTYIVADDAEDEENTKTNERMEANLRWFLGAVVQLGGAGKFKVMNIGTPQHQRSMSMTLKDMKGWETLHYKAINKDKDGDEVALWPEMRSMEWLRRERESLDSIGRVSVFHREYLCEVIGDEDQLFKPRYIQWFRGDLEYKNKKHFLVHDDKKDLDGSPLVVPVNVFMGVDPASAVNTSADFTAICTLAIDADGNRYVVDMVRKRMPPMEVADSIIATYRKYRHVKTQIETVGYQSMLADYIRRENDVFIPGVTIKNQPRRNKTERIEGLHPLFAQKQVFLNENHKEVMEAFRDELILFPRGKHDDTIDSFWYANKGVFRPYHDKAVMRDEKRLVRRKSYDWMID